MSYSPGPHASTHAKWWNEVGLPLLKRMKEKEERIPRMISEIHSKICPNNGQEG